MDHAQVLAAASEVVGAAFNKAPEAPAPPAAAPVAAAPVEAAPPPAAEPTAAPPTPDAVAEPSAEQEPAADIGEPPERIGAEEWLTKVTEGDESVSPEDDARLRAEVLGMLKLEDDPKVNEEIWAKVLQTKRGKALFGNVMKAARDGKLPSAEDFDSLRTLQLERAEMSEHFAHGTPEERQRFWQHWLVDQQGQLYEGATDSLQQLPQAIYRASPQAYEATERAFVTEFTNYAKAMAMRGGELAPSWRAIYENTQYAYLSPGKFDPAESADAIPAQNGHQNGHAAVPPEVQQELDQLRRQQQYSRQQAIRGAVESFHQSLDGGRRETIDRLVFGPGQNGSKPWNPAPSEREAHTLLISEKLRQALDSDQNFQREFELKRREALRSGSPQLREAATQFYVQSAENKLKAHVWPEYRKGLRPSADTRAQSQERHATLQQAQDLKQPGAGGTPVPAAATAPTGRQPGEDRSQWIRRVAEQEVRASMAS